MTRLLRISSALAASAVLTVIAGACSMAPEMTARLGFGEKPSLASAPTIPVESRPLNVSPVTSSSAAAAPPGSSIAVLGLPFAAGQVTKIREKHFINGTRQEIILAAGPGVYGENVIDVSVRTSGAKSADAANFLEMGPPSESGIRNEILSRFSDVRMSIVTRPVRNRFGRFGLAIGRHANGARCIFAWQWLDDLREYTPGVSNFTKFGAVMGNRAMATSIRMRLCRQGMTVDQLAGYVEGLKVPARQPVERLAAMDRRSYSVPRISQNGISRSPLLRPVGASLESALTGRAGPVKKVTPPPVKPKAKASKPRVKRSERRAAQRRPAGNYNRIQHYTKHGQPIGGAAPVVQGGRYLAPVNNPPPPASGPAAVGYKPSGGVSLPPEAYRGPRG